MFIISKILTYTFLPPGLFILLLLISLFLLKKDKKKYLTLSLIITCICIYLLSIEPVKNLMIMPLEDKYPPLKLDSYSDIDYIVILSGGIIPSSPDEEGKGSLSLMSLKRVLHGAFLHKKSNLPIIMTGGRVLRDKHVESEAEVAERMLIRLGIPAKKIHVEHRSRNTRESAFYIKKIFSPKKIILVTSAFHMPRSVYCFRRQKINCIPAPTNYLSNRDKFNLLSFLPSVGNLSGSYVAMKEYIGYYYYRIRN